MQTTSAVPSPTNQFDEYLPLVTQDLDRVTTHAAGLPGKSDLAFHRTLDRTLAKELDEASDRILRMTRDLLDLVDRGKNPKRRKMEDEDDVVEGYKRGVVDSVDALLEDADSCLDEILGRRKKAAIEIKPAYVAAASAKLPGPWSATTPQAAPNVVSNMYSVASWSVAKPQQYFPDPVDNSYDRPPWQPTLPVKHHAMVPLDHHNVLDYVIDSDPGVARVQLRREKRLLKHPYHYETKHIPYPTSMFTSNKPITPKPMDKTAAIWVETPEQLEAMTKELLEVKEVAVDLEHHDAHSYYGFTCLMQISTRQKDYLVDTLKLRGELREHKLGGVLADPSVVKVFHGSDSDIPWLQKDFDLYVVNLFDTYHATKVLQMTSHGLANLLLKYCNYTTDKRYQMADWRIRPLTKEMQSYAQSDTHFLLYIYDNLRNALLEQSRPPSPAPESSGSPAPSPDTNPQRAMRQVLDASAITALSTYEREVYELDPRNPYGPITSGFKRFFGDLPIESEYGYIYRRLHAWRDATARKEDEGVSAVLTNMMLFTLTKLRNPTIGAITNLTKSKWPIAMRESEAIQGIIQGAKVAWKDKIDSLNVIPAAQEVTSNSPTAAAQLIVDPTSAAVDVPEAASGSEWKAFVSTTSKPAEKPTSPLGNGQEAASKPKCTFTRHIYKSVPKRLADGFGAPAIELLQPYRGWHVKSSGPADLSAITLYITMADAPGISAALKEPIAPKRAMNEVMAYAETLWRAPDRAPKSGGSSSKLFGSSLRSSASAPMPEPVQPRSRLFGDLTRNVRSRALDSAGSRATFADVQKGIFADIAPAPRVNEDVEMESEVEQKVNELPAVETVPFVPPTARSTTAPAFATSSKKPDVEKVNKEKKVSKPIEDETPETVVVKKSKKAKKREREALAAEAQIDGAEASSPRPSAPESTGNAGPSVAEGPTTSEPLTKKQKKEKKARANIEAKDIPEFDYSAVPNLLDNPKEATASRAKGKKKKEKSTPVAITGSTFGKATQDKSQPKAGNLSKTFS